MSDIKFVRINGRIVPIKDKKPKDDSIFLKKAGIGATSTVLGAGATVGLLKGYKKPTLFLAGSAMAVGGYGLYKNIQNSIQHGKSKNSVLHGIGRFATNAGAGFAGKVAAAQIINRGSIGYAYRNIKKALK